MSSKADGPPPPKDPTDPKHPLLTESVKKKLKKLRKKKGTLPHWAATADLTLADKHDHDSDSDGSLSDLGDASILIDPAVAKVGRKLKRKGSFFGKDGPPAKKNFTPSALKALAADSPASTSSKTGTSRKPAPATATPSTSGTSSKPVAALFKATKSGTSSRPVPAIATASKSSSKPVPAPATSSKTIPTASAKADIFKPRSRATLKSVRRRLYTPTPTPTPDSSRPASTASEPTEPDMVLEDVTSENEDDLDYQTEKSQILSDTTGNLNFNPIF